MSKKLDKLHKQSQAIITSLQDDVRSSSQSLQTNLKAMSNEEKRVADVSRNAPAIIENIDKDFERKTRLQGWDITFLFLATAIQCIRQYLLSNDKFRLQDMGSSSSSARGEKLMKDLLNTSIGPWRPVPPDVAKILTQSVPYDAVNFISPEVKDSLGNLGLSGSTHRYRTLGHDPVLGWVFGPLNIITSSLTRYDFISFGVQDKKIACIYPGNMIGDAIGFCNQDHLLYPTAIARQAVHFGSDYFTKQGLPVPLISTVNNDLSNLMTTKAHIDAWSITRGAVLSMLINQLVYCVHMLLWNESKDGPRSMYEIRTRRILSYSNVLATSSNILVTAFTGDLTKLDVGGMIVTLHRLIQDTQFIADIKKDFLKNEVYNLVVGSEYDFIHHDEEDSKDVW